MKKAAFGRFTGREGRPPFVIPPFAAAQYSRFAYPHICGIVLGLGGWRNFVYVTCSQTDAANLSNGFLQSEVLGEVSVLEGGSSGRSFSRSLPRSFPRSFRSCFAGTFRAKKTSAKTSALNSHGPAQQNWRNFREKTS